jgi:hypothetical protein
VKLTVGNHESEHKFRIVGDGVNIPYNGLVGRDFFQNKQANIDYMQREIVGKVRLRFDDNRHTMELDKRVRVVLQPRCETVVKLPTRSK